MGVRAQLIDEAGTVVRLEDADGLSFNAAGDFDDLLYPIRGGSASALGGVDPYGTVSLAAADMPRLIADIDTLIHQGRPGPESNGLRRLRLLACHCVQLPGSQLVLEGD